MAFIDQLLNYEQVKLPGAVGTAFDAAVGVGSWLKSGMEGYKTALAEWNAFKRYVNRLGNLKEDPQALFYTLNSLLRANPTKMPAHMSAEDFNLIRSFLNRRTSNKPITELDKSVATHWKLKGTGLDLDKIEDSLFSSFYNEQDSIPMPFGESVSEDGFAISMNPDVEKKKIEDIENKVIQMPRDNSGTDLNVPNPEIGTGDSAVSVFLEESPGNYNRLFKEISPLEWLGVKDENGKLIKEPSSNDSITPGRYSTGYKQLSDPYYGYKELKSPKDIKTHLDLVSFGYKNWAGFEIGTDHLWSISMAPYHHESYTSKFGPFPSYYLPSLSSLGKTGKFNFGDFLPVISYNLQFGNQVVKDVPLYNNSKIQFPIGFSYDMILSMDIIDDVYHSMKKYLNQCLNNIYDLNKNECAPFFQAAWIINLVIYRSGFEINYRVRLIGCPINYTPVYEGQNDPQESRLHLELAIVGIINPGQGYVMGNSKKSDDTKNWEDKTTWTEIMLNPNKDTNSIIYKDTQNPTPSSNDTTTNVPSLMKGY